MKVIVLTYSNTKVFVAVLSRSTDLIEWCTKWIEKDDQNIEFWEGGEIDILPCNEICIKGDNGMIFLNIQEIELIS